MRHSKGPWNVHGVEVLDQDAIKIATSHGVTLDEALANADLISAAPEMLEAIEALLKQDDLVLRMPAEIFLKLSKSAIKARGEK